MKKICSIPEVKVTNLKKSDWITAPDLITTLSNHTGYDYAKAIFELVDNSLAANATQINCNIYKNAQSETVFVLSDNGDGMSELDITKHFITLGNSANKLNKKSSSYFGIGGKTGIEFISNTNGEIEIITHKKDNKPYLLKWKQGSTPEYGEIENENINFGTTIIVKDSKLNADFTAGELIIYLGVFYYPTLSTRKDITLRVNNNLVKGIDPFYRNLLNDSFYHFETCRLNDKDVKITFIHFDETTPLKEEQANAFDKKIMTKSKKGHFLSSVKSSGLYFVYGGRYLTIGDNMNYLGKTVHSSFNGSRAEICIDKDMAETLHIAWNKTNLTTRLDKIDEAKELLDTLLRLFNLYAKEPIKLTPTRKEPKIIKETKDEIFKMSNKDFIFELTTINHDCDMPLLTFNFASYKGRKNGKKTGVFNVNPLSRKYPTTEGKVKELYNKFKLVLPILCEVCTNHRNETEIKNMIDKFFSF